MIQVREAEDVEQTFREVAVSAEAKLARDSQIRRNLPGPARLYVERKLPFLCVYRSPPGREDPGTGRLVTAMSAYLASFGDASQLGPLSLVAGAVGRSLAREGGDFLFMEIWSAPRPDRTGPIGFMSTGIRFRAPSFRVFVSDVTRAPKTIDVLVRSLRGIRLGPSDDGEGQRDVVVEVVEGKEPAPPGLPPILGRRGTSPPRRDGKPDRRRKERMVVVGIEVSPIYRHPTKGVLFPETLRILRRALSLALQEAAYAFAHEHTTLRFPHPHALGRRNIGRTAYNVDRTLGDVADSYDFLLSITPVNADQAWTEFHRSRFEKKPRLLYRPLALDPQQLKRRLFRVPIERIEDTLIADIFREKQDELDREITMLRALGTEDFFYGSLRRYGGVDDPLLKLAETVLKRIPPKEEEPAKQEYVEQRAATRTDYVDADEFRRLSIAEIRRYTRTDERFTADVEIRSDMVAGLMVSGGKLLVNQSLRTPRTRVKALLHHEIGTHLVTRYNGERQPFRQLRSGLAGYERLQEGLAVLSEYLAGGLSSSRARVLAGRVIAVRARIDGASFVETFRILHRRHGFRPKAAFLTTLRAFRGGGLTKDAVYLEGIRDVLAYLARGGEMEPLVVGKIDFHHLPMVEELRLREILDPPALIPRYMTEPAALERLTACRKMSVFELVRTGER
jgi:uncharacterized protein (TIGR02421 family)